MKKFNYTYELFSKDVKKLVSELKPFSPFIKNIYGVPRGGLFLATTLSYALDIPLIFDKEKINDKTLIVDDISDSGKTLIKLLKGKKFYKTVTLFWKVESQFKPNFFRYPEEKGTWIVFPWETKQSSKKDNTKV